MTKRYVERCVRVWQARLGLAEWAVAIDWEHPAQDGAYASIWRPDDYLMASMRFEAGWRKRGTEHINRSVVHELVHLHMREVSRAHDFILDEVDDQAARVAVRAWKHAEEYTTDKIANALVDAMGVVA